MRGVGIWSRWTLCLWWISLGVSLVFVLAVQPASALSQDDILNQVNHSRVVAGVEPLEGHPALNSSAYAKAEHMLALDYWDHYGPDNTSPWTFINSSGYDYSRAGENLGRGFSTVDGLVNAWLNSPAHRANQLNEQFTEVGIAVIAGTMDGKQTTVVVMHFGVPKTSTVNPVNQKKIPDNAETEAVRSDEYIEMLRGFWAVISRITIKTIIETAF